MRILVGLALLGLAACNGGNSFSGNEGEVVTASGAGGARDYAATDFTRVELRGPDDVQVTTGGSFSVRAEGATEILDEIEIRRDGDRLLVGRRNREGWNWRSDDAGARIVITMPSIRAGTLAGSGDLTVNRASGDFDAALAGSGDLTIGVLQGGRSEFAIAGSGTIAASGQVDEIDISIAGSGDVSAAGLRAGGAHVSIAGSGNVTARVDGEARVSILGSGDVDLGPGARCTVSALGSGTARCGQTTGDPE